MASTKRILAFGLAGLVLLGAGIAVAASESGATSSTGARAGLKEKLCRALGGDGEAGKPCLPGAKGRGPGCSAALKAEGGAVAGKNVRFGYDAATGAVSAYASLGPFADRELFASITLAKYDAANATEKSACAVFGVRDGALADFAAFDAPNAAWTIRSAEGNTVTIRVAAGLAVEPVVENGTTRAAKITDGSHAGVVRVHGGDASLAVADGVITATLGERSGVSFHVEGYPHALAHEGKLAKRHAMHDGPRGERPPPPPRDARPPRDEAAGEAPEA